MVAVAYERSFNYRALTGNLMFWIGGRLREVVAHGGSTELTNCLRGFAEHNRYKKICNLWTPLNTRNLHGGNTVHISLKAKININVTDSIACAVFGGKANMANRWAGLLLVLTLAPRDFSPGAPVFPSPQKPTLPIPIRSGTHGHV